MGSRMLTASQISTPANIWEHWAGELTELNSLP